MNSRCFSKVEQLLEIVSAGGVPLCLYSGGLDGTYLLTELFKHGCRSAVVLSVNLGGGSSLEQTSTISRLGFQPIIRDQHAQFVTDYVLPAIRAQARYLGTHPLSASLSRPMLASIAVEEARKNGCNIIVHTATASQNSLRRFNGALRDIGFDGYFGSPFAECFIPREQKLRSIGIANIECRTFTGITSTDVNIWCREFEYGPVNDPEKVEIPDEQWLWTSHLELGRDSVELQFEKGLPVSLDGQRSSPEQIIETLNQKGGRFRLGRYVSLEEGPTGIKVLEAREMPAAHILLEAYRFIESACLKASTIREKQHVEQLWVQEAVEGRWFGSLREACEEFIKRLSKSVSGHVRFTILPYSLELSSVRAAIPTYTRDRESIEKSLLS